MVSHFNREIRMFREATVLLAERFFFLGEIERQRRISTMAIHPSGLDFNGQIFEMCRHRETNANPGILFFMTGGISGFEMILLRCRNNGSDFEFTVTIDRNSTRDR